MFTGENKMKRCFALIAIFFLSVTTNYSQDKKELNLTKDETFHLYEVGAYIIKDKGNFKIQFLAPEEFRIPAYKNVDLKKDDIILVINGISVNQAGDFKEAYEKLNPGKDIKLQIKRGGKMMTVTLKKADPKDLPKKGKLK
jgi:predicted metalloprotease with PDZ domain